MFIDLPCSWGFRDKQIAARLPPGHRQGWNNGRSSVDPRRHIHVHHADIYKLKLVHFKTAYMYLCILMQWAKHKSKHKCMSLLYLKQHGHPKAYFFHAGVTIWSTRAVNSLSSSLWHTVIRLVHGIRFWSIYVVRICLSTLMNVTARFTQSLLWMFNFHIVYVSV